MVECLAEKSVRTRRELHPIIISFFAKNRFLMITHCMERG